VTVEVDVIRLAEQFADRVLQAAVLPRVRRDDLRESCEIAAQQPRLSLTCTITGSTYEREWDGSESQAMQLVDEAADSTAHLIRARHYAWMHSKT
jgi:hypothetical protein